MPCPLFEPRSRVNRVLDTLPRLPLIHEYAGICHAGEIAVDAFHRFTYCNRGNAKGHCDSFPKSIVVSAVRFAVIGVSAQSLTVQVVEEQDHWPLTWTKVEFLISEDRLEPEISDVCRRAQVLQFCVSYLEKTK